MTIDYIEFSGNIYDELLIPYKALTADGRNDSSVQVTITFDDMGDYSPMFASPGTTAYNFRNFKILFEDGAYPRTTSVELSNVSYNSTLRTVTGTLTYNQFQTVVSTCVSTKTTSVVIGVYCEYTYLSYDIFYPDDRTKDYVSDSDTRFDKYLQIKAAPKSGIFVPVKLTNGNVKAYGTTGTTNGVIISGVSKPMVSAVLTLDSDLVSLGITMKKVKIKYVGSSNGSEIIITKGSTDWIALPSDIAVSGTTATLTDIVLEGVAGTDDNAVVYIDVYIGGAEGSFGYLYGAAVTASPNITVTQVTRGFPSLTLTAYRTASNAEDDITETNDGLYGLITATYSNIDHDSAKTLTIRYKQNEETTWTTLSADTLTDLTGTVSKRISVAEASSYDIEATLTDGDVSVKKTTTIYMVFALMHWAASGRGMGFGKLVSNASDFEGFEFGLPARFYDGIYLENTNILTYLRDIFYPVGTIYTSTNSTNPSNFIGGTWEAYAPGRMLLGAGSNGSTTYTAGNRGGSEAVPYHTHSFTGSAGTTGNQSANHTHGLNGHTHSFSAATSSAGAHSHPSPSGKYYLCAPDITSSDSASALSGSGYYFPRSTVSGWTHPSSTPSAGAHTHTVSGTSGGNSGSTGSNSANHTHSFTPSGTVGYAGTSGNNNMPPYITVYHWLRTA